LRIFSCLHQQQYEEVEVEEQQWREVGRPPGFAQKEIYPDHETGSFILERAVDYLACIYP
jgi:hypothetical protein